MTQIFYRTNWAWKSWTRHVKINWYCFRIPPLFHYKTRPVSTWWACAWKSRSVLKQKEGEKQKKMCNSQVIFASSSETIRSDICPKSNDISSKLQAAAQFQADRKAFRETIECIHGSASQSVSQSWTLNHFRGMASRLLVRKRHPTKPKLISASTNPNVTSTSDIHISWKNWAWIKL